MSKKQVTIYLDEDLLEQLNTETGKLNKRLLDLIQKGLTYEQQSNPKYIVENTFTYLKELVRLRDSKEIRILLQKK
mgnify:CR=1 FL=1